MAKRRPPEAIWIASVAANRLADVTRLCERHVDRDLKNVRDLAAIRLLLNEHAGELA
jgi:hypothetical protein